MTLATAWLDAVDGTNTLDARIRYSCTRFEVQGHPGDAGRLTFEDVDPIREFVSYPQKPSLESRFWMSPLNEDVLFASFWERSFLMLLDRTSTAQRVSVQPMMTRWQQQGVSHVPDATKRQQRPGSRH